MQMMAHYSTPCPPPCPFGLTKQGYLPSRLLVKNKMASRTGFEPVLPP